MGSQGTTGAYGIDNMRRKVIVCYEIKNTAFLLEFVVPTPSGRCRTVFPVAPHVRNRSSVQINAEY